MNPSIDKNGIATWKGVKAGHVAGILVLALAAALAIGGALNGSLPARDEAAHFAPLQSESGGTRTIYIVASQADSIGFEEALNANLTAGGQKPQIMVVPAGVELDALQRALQAEGPAIEAAGGPMLRFVDLR